MTEEWLKPAAAASRLQMPASTLRVYSTRFGSLLSSSASDPPAGPDGKRGSRLYGSTDIAILGRAKELLATGLTYEQVLSDLRLSLPGARHKKNGGTETSCPMVAAGVQQAQFGITSQQVENLAAGLVNAAISQLDIIAKNWESLAEERAKEITSLRERIQVLEDQLRLTEERKPSGLSRIFRW